MAGHESIINTPVGRDGSQRYSSKIRLETLRHAIIGQLRNPPKGFEEITRRHFGMCRQRIVVQARRWMLESRGSPLEQRFRRAYEQLLALFSEQEWGDVQVLPPSNEDMAFLTREDPSFVAQEDSKPAASASQPTEAEKEYMATAIATMISATNPWAVSATEGGVSNVSSHQSQQNEADEDDFYS